MSNKKELERQKRQQEEMAAAEVFKEFVETFEKPQSTSKTFVLGSVFNSGHEGIDFYLLPHQFNIFSY